MECAREKTACFTGHRPEKLPWGRNESDPRCLLLKRVLADVIAAAYDEGVRRFLCGMAAGADMYAGEAVVALRDDHPDVLLTGVIPFRGQDGRFSAALKTRYRRLAEECDELVVLHDAYVPGCMMERNRYMVDRSSMLITIYDGRPGGTKSTREYAASRGLTIVELPVLREADTQPPKG